MTNLPAQASLDARPLCLLVARCNGELLLRRGRTAVSVLAEAEHRTLALATVEAMRAAAHQRDATLISMLAYAGLRPQEALALQWAYGHVIDELDDQPRVSAEEAIQAARRSLCPSRRRTAMRPERRTPATGSVEPTAGGWS